MEKNCTFQLFLCFAFCVLRFYVTLYFLALIHPKWMRSSRVVRASDSQCQSGNCPGLDSSILRHNGIQGAADRAILNKVLQNSKKSTFNLFAVFLTVLK
jgi:hypothetical protein